MGNITGKNEQETEQLVDKLESIRDGSLATLNKILNDHGKPSPVVSTEELNSFLLQVKHRMMLVAVVGEGSSGKSTLLNAFLRDRFLPTGVKRDTAIRVYIGHDSKRHLGRCTQPGGTCSSCPILCSGFSEKTLICRGVKNIKAKINQINQLVDEKKEDMKFLVLYAYLSIFDFVDNTDQTLRPFFIDSPGIEEFRDDIKLYYSIESSLMYIENYTRFLQKKDKIKKELALKPKEAKLFFVVSHFDNYFALRGEENNPDENGIKHDLKSTFEDIDENDVYPVCGQWAFHAHFNKFYPEDEIAKQVLDDACMYYRRRRNLEKPKESDTVIEISGFEELETKLKESVQDTDMNMWSVNIFTQCSEFLEHAIVSGDQLTEKIKADQQTLAKDIETSKRKVDRIDQYRQDFLDFGSESQLKQSIEIIIQSSVSKSLPALSVAINQFCDACKMRAKQEVYKLKEFKKDLHKFEHNDLPDALRKTLSSETNSCFDELKKEIQKKYNNLIICINSDAEEVKLSEKFNIELDELKGFQTTFTDFECPARDREQSNRRWNWGKAGGFGFAGAGVSGGLLGISATSLVALTLPVAVIAAPVGLGLLGVAVFGYKALSSDDDDAVLRKEDIEKICTKLKGDYLENVTSTYFVSEKEKVCTILFENMKGFVSGLEKNYIKNWKAVHEQLKETLEEKNKKLKSLNEAILNLEKALKELKECQSYSNQNLRSINERNQRIDSDYDLCLDLF